MQKLRLDPDDLRVDSFAPADERGEDGTVFGHSYPNGCFPPSDSDDPFVDTCGYATCAGITCSQSCNGYTCTGCGTGGTGPSLNCESAGYTYCFKDVSCMNQCFPPTG